MFCYLISPCYCFSSPLAFSTLKYCTSDCHFNNLSIFCFLPLMACCSVDDAFPVVTFHFKGSLSLKVYPHDYLFPVDVSIFGTWALDFLDSVK